MFVPVERRGVGKPLTAFFAAPEQRREPVSPVTRLRATSARQWAMQQSTSPCALGFNPAFTISKLPMCPPTSKHKPPNFLWRIGPIILFRVRIMHFLQHWPRLESETGRGGRHGPESVVESAISELLQAGHRIRRTLLAHRQRYVDTGGTYFTIIWC
jgi:hypothetical protein